MTLDEIKADIVSACRQFQERGFKVVSGDGYGNVCEGGKRGCALVAVVAVNDKIPNGAYLVRGFAEKRYGWSYDQTSAFMSGFDGGQRQAHLQEYQLGRAVRAEVLP